MMNKIVQIGLTVCMTFFMGLSIRAQQALNQSEGNDATQNKMDVLINGYLSGVQKIKYNQQGIVESLIVIGRAPVQRVFDRATSARNAMKEADAEARNEFVKWLTTQVSWKRTSSNEVVICKKGTAAGDTGTATSTAGGTLTNLTSEESTQRASGFVKGAIQIGAGISPLGEAVVVLGWSRKNAESADFVGDVNKPTQPSTSPQTKTPGNPEQQPEGVNQPTPPGTSVSDDGREFL